ncbi:MAG: methyl-accepting chemotaxis protein [Candidatus Delongbacteria bacterium]|nr:methyl-accepting chemotaxis protein [Candidatus Delongbacteria bacterium]MBN2833539.1 methyl-accepting chemotaxis protein [Candidatus Delongbacteria bacterium]
MLKEIAEGDGDLSRRLEISSNDEIGELAEYFNVFVEKLQDVIRLTNDHIYDISIGNIPEPIVQEFHGDFETIKESINELIKVNTKMLDEISNVVSSAEKSDFSIRANSLGCLGDWQKVLIGVNELVGISEGFVEKVKNNIIDLERESTKIRKVLEYQNLESSKISNILQEIANGDLSVEYRPENENLDNSEIYDIFLQISNSLGNTIFSLSSVLNETRIVSSDIEENAFLLSNVSKNMSTGASEQAKSLDELTVAVSEISTQTKLNAENAQMASKLAFEAKEASEIGNKEMTDLAKAMFEISSSANGIMKVIKVIDDIAFQTNLLALNAAVEAARAGVHGRGFAVVADEVRNLAQKSAEAARETADLIQASTAKSEKGNSLSNRTAKSLKEIEDKISKAVELIEEIAISSEEQAKGIEYSNKALIQIGKIAKENTETSIETENSTNKLLDHIEDLKKSLNMFKIR